MNNGIFLKKTQLYQAVENSDINMMKFLLKNGDNIENEFFGENFLDKASKDGKIEMVKCLIENVVGASKKNTTLFLYSKELILLVIIVP